eukprot:TRINITY_DN5191_c0_g1_i1.p1 TRINITY_DN5191_c0_g1~~TRINITY_DN5191_c0_g1_i1.p1  ORF type:complete len:622 (+),score=66.59 TRINITY_DN5191_c0_g1_i1:429-2294(+)
MQSGASCPETPPREEFDFSFPALSTSRDNDEELLFSCCETTSHHGFLPFHSAPRPKLEEKNRSGGGSEARLDSLSEACGDGYVGRPDSADLSLRGDSIASEGHCPSFSRMLHSDSGRSLAEERPFPREGSDPPCLSDGRQEEDEEEQGEGGGGGHGGLGFTFPTFGMASGIDHLPEATAYPKILLKARSVRVWRGSNRRVADEEAETLNSGGGSSQALLTPSAPQAHIQPSPRLLDANTPSPHPEPFPFHERLPNRTPRASNPIHTSSLSSISEQTSSRQSRQLPTSSSSHHDNNSIIKSPSPSLAHPHGTPAVVTKRQKPAPPCPPHSTDDATSELGLCGMVRWPKKTEPRKVKPLSTSSFSSVSASASISASSGRSPKTMGFPLPVGICERSSSSSSCAFGGMCMGGGLPEALPVQRKEGERRGEGGGGTRRPPSPNSCGGLTIVCGTSRTSIPSNNPDKLLVLRGKKGGGEGGKQGGGKEGRGASGRCLRTLNVERMGEEDVGGQADGRIDGLEGRKGVMGEAGEERVGGTLGAEALAKALMGERSLRMKEKETMQRIWARRQAWNERHLDALQKLGFNTEILRIGTYPEQAIAGLMNEAVTSHQRSGTRSQNKIGNY